MAASAPGDPGRPAQGRASGAGDGAAEDQAAEDEAAEATAGETEPDPRFTFANERTFLAWTRTALALVGAGLAVSQLLPPFHGAPWGRRAIGIPLILLGGAVPVVSYLEWTRDQRALRLGLPLGRSRMPLILSVVITAECLLAAALVLFARTAST